jgi:hypothetical protein
VLYESHKKGKFLEDGEDYSNGLLLEDRKDVGDLL